MKHVRDEVRLRVMQAAEYIAETGATVRACAAKFGVSKTTIHKDMRDRLPALDEALGRQVAQILEKNLRERHLRGGAATRARYRGRTGEAAGQPAKAPSMHVKAPP